MVGSEVRQRAVFHNAFQLRHVGIFEKRAGAVHSDDDDVSVHIRRSGFRAGFRSGLFSGGFFRFRRFFGFSRFSRISF